MSRWWLGSIGVGVVLFVAAAMLFFNDPAPLPAATVGGEREAEQVSLDRTPPEPECNNSGPSNERRIQEPGPERGPFSDGSGGQWVVVTAMAESSPATDADRFGVYEVAGTLFDGRPVRAPAMRIDKLAAEQAISAIAQGHRLALFTRLSDDGTETAEPDLAFMTLVSRSEAASSFVGTCAELDLEDPLREKLGDRFDSVMWALPLTPPGDATYELIHDAPRPPDPPPPTTIPEITYTFSTMVFVVTADGELPDGYACFRSPQISWGESVKCVPPSESPIRYQATVSNTREMRLWYSPDRTVPLPVELVGALSIPEDIFATAERPAVRVHLTNVHTPAAMSFEILGWGDAVELDFAHDPLWTSPFETLRPG